MVLVVRLIINKVCPFLVFKFMYTYQVSLIIMDLTHSNYGSLIFSVGDYFVWEFEETLPRNSYKPYLGL